MPNKKIALLALVLVTLASCKENISKEVSLTGKTRREFKKEGLLHLIKADGTKIKTIDLEIADTAFERETDLKNHTALNDDQGVLFIYSLSELRGYYMKDIPFPLDLIFLNEKNEIVSFYENAKPLDETTFLPSQVPALSVLKINSGLSEEWVLEVGDYVEIIKTL